MTRSLLWDASPGETRLGLIEDNALAELHLLRSNSAPVMPGAIFTARLMERPTQGKARVSLGGDVEALLQPAPKLNEGARIAVEVTRAAIPEPGRWKLPMVRPKPATQPMVEASWHGGESPAQLLLRRIGGDVTAILVRDALTLADLADELGPGAPPLRVDAATFDAFDLDSVIDAAVTGEFALPDGIVTIERTRAMTTVDIDGSGDALTLNLAAARSVPPLLRLLGIGGSVVIDFLSLADRSQRQSVDAALEAACTVLGPHKRTAINGFGLAQIVRARSMPSLPEMLCGTTPGRLTAASRAAMLLREAARATGHGRRSLTAPTAVIEAIRSWPDALDALRRTTGAEIELVADPAAIGYGHVHVSQL